MNIQTRAKNILNFLLDSVFPKSKVAVLIDNLSFEQFVEKAGLADYNDSKIKAIFNYQDKFVKDFIWELKYHKNQRVIEFCGQALYLEITKNKPSDETILIPSPISKKRLNERGYNQSELICKEIIKLDKENLLKLETNILIKNKNTINQTDLKRKARLKNLKGCFEIKNTGKIIGKNIILIDDVWTTGTTIERAEEMLIKSGAKSVRAFTVAH